MKKTRPRLIITAQYLVQKFGHLELDIFLAIMAPFASTYDECLKCFEDMIDDVDKMPEAPGKQGALEIWCRLKQAYLKMSPLERERIRVNLPGTIALYLFNKHKPKPKKRR